MFDKGDYVEYKNSIFYISRIFEYDTGYEYLIKHERITSSEWCLVSGKEIEHAKIIWIVSNEGYVDCDYALKLSLKSPYLAWFQNEDDARLYAACLS